MIKDYVLEKRKFVIGGTAILIVLIYLVRLFVLQISTDDYKKNADSNAFLNKTQYPSRGAIYDRNGQLLVRSEEHTSELQYHSELSYAVFCFKQKTHHPPVT